MGSYESFAADSRVAGFEEVLVQGEMWLTVGDSARHLRAGEPRRYTGGASRGS